MQPALKIAVAGLGTVGAATVQLLERQAEPVGLRAGRRIVVVAASARDRRRDRGVDLSAVRWYDAAAAMAADPEIDAVVELIGGADGIALDVVETALARGKHVVTANKALIAKHGLRLARSAEEAGVALAFEAQQGAMVRLNPRANGGQQRSGERGAVFRADAADQPRHAGHIHQEAGFTRADGPVLHVVS